MATEQKGFTLIELLIVIAIIAILSVVVILTLNPAELLKQARDSNRVSDMAALKTAIALYLSDGQAWTPNSVTCYESIGATVPQCGYFSALYSLQSGTTTILMNGTGWLPVSFTLISSGAPFAKLPLDPVNNGTYYYGYAASSTNNAFEIDAKMESSKYNQGGPADVVSNDGGNNATVYETGTKLDL